MQMLTIIISDNYVQCIIYVLSLTHIIFDMDASLNKCIISILSMTEYWPIFCFKV